MDTRPELVAADAAEQFRGRVVLVTGAGSGIGRETALRFAAAGADVAAVDIDAIASERTAAAIAERGGNAIGLAGDVTSESEVEGFVAATVERYGSIAVLVNNAGGGAPVTIESSAADWDRQIALNLRSSFLVSRAVWPSMRERGGGVILNAASIAGRWALPGLMAYCAAKAGIVMLTKSLALEGAPLGIRANCVVPGNVHTPALQKFFDGQDDPQAAWDAANRAASLGRIGSTADIAQAYLYLASDAAAWITGADLLVDGGMTLGASS